MDKVALIKAEIERRYNYEKEMYCDTKPDGRPNNGWAESLAIMGELEELLSFLDTLSEEPVEGLEEAAEKSSVQYYMDAGYSPFPNVETAAHKSGFIAGAEWQAEHTPLPEDTVLFQKGVEEGKRLMMEDAVEGEVVKDINNKLAVTAKNVNLDRFNFGDKVRIIVCKKEDKK